MTITTACTSSRLSAWAFHASPCLQSGPPEISDETSRARGEGKFERISWEEAYDIIATKMQRLIKEYGNESIYLNYGTGTLGGTMTRSWPPGNTGAANELLRRLSEPLWRLLLRANCGRSELYLRRLGRW